MMAAGSDAAPSRAADDANPLRWGLTWWAYLLFLAVTLVGGGSARADAASLLYMRPVTVVCLLWFLIVVGRAGLREVRMPLILLGLMATVILLQLVPLPPDLWLSLPGRAMYAESAAVANIPQPWRPLSLTPNLALNSLLSLLTPITAVVGFAALGPDQRRMLLPALIGCAALSAVLGVFQLAGSDSLYLYRVTNEARPVGFLANRNHQAVLLAAALPLLRAWTLLPPRHIDPTRRLFIAAAAALPMVLVIAVSGSRAGILLGAIALLAAALMGPAGISGQPRGARPLALRLAVVAIPVALVAAAALLGRGTGIERMVGSPGEESEARFAYLPLMLRIARDFLPWGSGFGSFDPVFRSYEPDDFLGPRYFNHAHNDLLELGMTGGIPALLALLAFLVWFGWRSVVAARLSADRPPVRIARAGAIVLLFFLGASLVDYPLRAPLIMAVAAIAACWLACIRPCQAARRVVEGDGVVRGIVPAANSV